MTKDSKIISAQVETIRNGFPWLEIIDSAKPGKGIEQPSEKEIEEALEYLDKAEVQGRCKFVPASGAASRMFKAVFAKEKETLLKICDSLPKFAFYSEDIFGKPPYNPERVADLILTDEGLGYGSKPKGVLKFHRYPDETRTAIAEHLVEGAEYMRNSDGSVNLTVTISPEHTELFKAAIAEVQDKYEKRYGVKYNIRLTYQDKSTDTVAVGTDGKPFITDEGEMLFRPAGHGALIKNLQDVDEELVSIKNIDNVANERLLPVCSRSKKLLMGRALQLRDRIFGYIYALDQLTELRRNQADFSYIPVYNALQDDPYSTPECQELCNEIEEFLRKTLLIEMPEAKDCRDRAEALRAKLNRPIRVCGMVRNEGEPGGGPFIIRGKDGSTSLQILEGAQINKEDSASMKAISSATHFNPVDLVCCLRDYKGDKFNLEEHVDPETGFISSKSYQGRELKALELPGLWNGAMSDWNTLFVEVPIETFNPTKVMLDLLRPAHQ